MTRPRQPHGPNPPGRLPAAMLRALAAELSDPGRFSRAKAYARDGAVVDIDVQPGVVQATIQGSRYEPYVASVVVGATDDTTSLLGLIPDRDELVASCSCPDDASYDGAFCKHALATLLTLADEVTIDPGVLTRWRAGDADTRSDGPDRPLGRGGELARATDRRAGRADRPVVDVLAELVTAPATIPDDPDLPRRLPVSLAARHHGQHLSDVNGDVVARVLADALSVLRAR
ncbi:MAG: SWIM zinc finger family protein [Ilumatobacteraceae bacterium]